MSSPIAPSRDAEIASLTTIRGLAASWVVVFHFSSVLFDVLPEARVLEPLVAAGPFAVPLFFVLSGYVLGQRYLESLAQPSLTSLWRFWALRLGRVYPVHIVTLVASITMASAHGWTPKPGQNGEAVVTNVLLIQAWMPRFALSWNYPAWSISSEWFAYLIFPLVTSLLAGRSRSWSTAGMMLLGALSATVYAVEPYLPFKGVLVVLPTFIGGVLISKVYPPGSLMRSPRRAEILVAIAALLPFAGLDSALLAAGYLGIFFALVASLGGAGHYTSPFWQGVSLVYLGEVSYSLYMTHALSITLLTRFFPLDSLVHTGAITRISALLGYLGAIFAVALAMYYAVDRPGRLWVRRRLQSRAASLHVQAGHPDKIGMCNGAVTP